MSDSETKVINSSVTSSLRMSPSRQNIKAESVERPPSPETNCAICLEELRNKSYTNTCLHQFCFHCLLEWSKVKPECPLCKQGFSRIYHNIRSNDDYDEHILEPPMPPPPLDPHIFINVAFQRHRFRYRSALGGSMMWSIQDIDPLSVSSSWAANHNYPIDYSVAAPTSRPVRQGATTTRSVTRNQRLDLSAFRRNVYRQGLWVRPGQASRFRECSPEFYRLNPAQTHRLVPWLTRELNVLLDMQYDTHTVCQDVINLILTNHINSSVFHRAMTFYLGSRAEHFIHEFYHYAISPHDMNAYDAVAQYGQVGREFSSESDSDVEMLNLPEPLVNLDLTTAPGPSGLQQPPAAAAAAGAAAAAVPEPSSSSQPEPEAQPSTNTVENYIVIELSDDEDHRNAQSDSDVEILCQVPPRHLRTPEVITIDSDSDTDIETVEPKSEPNSIHYDVVSSGDETEEPEEDEIEEANVAAEECTYVPHQPRDCQCPLYDNCPYSREVHRTAEQNRRSSYKRESLFSSTLSYTSSTTSSSSSSSSLGTEAEEFDVSSTATTSRGTTSSSTRHRHKKSSVSSKKKSCKSRSHLKRKRTHKCRRGRERSSKEEEAPLAASTTEETSSSDDIYDSNSSSVEKKRKLPSRLKSIVLKVDKSSASSKPSTSNSSSARYLRRRDSTSETDE